MKLPSKEWMLRMAKEEGDHEISAGAWTPHPLSKPMGREGDDDTFVDGYMCATDWECELGMAADGNRVFPSVECLKDHLRCAEECGIVKVRVQFLEVVQHGEQQAKGDLER